MLTPHVQEPAKVEARNRRRERKLWERPNLTPSLGCWSCPEFTLCGGLHTKSNLFDCLDHCCNDHKSCTRVCRAKPSEFVQRIREIGGFDLANVARGPVLAAPSLPSVIPLIYHGNRRSRLYQGGAIALSLHRLLNRATGEPKFRDEAELRAAFGIGQNTAIVLTGTDQDPPLERWWRYGEAARATTIRALRGLGVSLVTTPNYSLFADNPRWDDLHSMKRIALVNAEFLQLGLASALHVNARSDTDAARWASFVSAREEITHVAYEFTTGSGRAERLEVHARWLARMADAVRRPLTLVVRGGVEALPILTSAFASVVFLETSAFMKAMNRQRAVVSGNANVSWEHLRTPLDADLDDLFEHNVRLTTEAIEMFAAPALERKGSVAA